MFFFQIKRNEKTIAQEADQYLIFRILNLYVSIIGIVFSIKTSNISRFTSL